MISPCKLLAVSTAKLKRLAARKYMTIPVGFLCRDGIVLGTDSQESYGGCALKHSVPKQVAFPPIEIDDNEKEPPDRRVIFTGAGDSALVDKLTDKAWLEAAVASPNIVEMAAGVQRSRDFRCGPDESGSSKLNFF
jgi:hypothetical protein